MDTLIIGAGIAGLLAATELQKAGQQVTILDKGRSVGGRMATHHLRPNGESVADHGAQFFTVRDAQFQQWVEDWLRVETAAEWCLGFASIDGDPHYRDGHPRYRGSTGMNAIPKHLATKLNVLTQSKVVTIGQKENLWCLETESGMLYRAKNLIVTSPVPQSLALLDAGSIKLPADAQQSLETIHYDPCFAVMVLLNEKSNIPNPGGLQIQGETIDWIGDNHQKGISAQTTVTIHASAQFTRKHLQDNSEQVGKLLIDAAHTAGYFDKMDILETKVHRWLYAKPTTLYPERCLRVDINGLPLIFAGDAFKHARVEGAALSGLASAANLIG